MKKLISILLILTCFISFNSFSVNAEELKDVPDNHWAYKSVKKLIDKGYLSLYEDGTFKGNNKVSRYELAVIIARMLDDIQDTGTQVSEEDADTLRKLSLEFRDELVDLAKKHNNLLKRLKSVEDKNIIQSDAIGNNREKINNIDKEISSIIDSILELKKLNDEIDKLNKEIKEQNITITNLKESLNKNKSSISDINSKMNNISSEIENKDAIKDLKDQQSVTVTNVHSLKNKVNTLNEKITSQEKIIKGLKEQNEKYQLYLIGVAALSLIIQ